jgi:hypothetical protein
LFSVFIVECSYPTDFYDQQLDGIVRLPLPSVTEAPFDNAFPREERSTRTIRFSAGHWLMIASYASGEATTS